jgi:cell wall-associated NlpC family hydrolase
MTSDIASGASFNVGTTAVTYTATDAQGLVTTASFTVTVSDSELPTVSAPGAVTVTAALNSCTATATLGSATTADNCGVATSTNNAPAVVAQVGVSGSTYTVVKNDSLSGIALKAKVSLSSFLAVNGFKKTSVIVPGQIVKLPAGAIIASTPAATAGTNAVPSRLQVVLDFARAQIGKPYAFGKAGPTSYDCSGLTLAAFAQVKVSLPHQSLAQSKLGSAVDWRVTGVQAGDLVFTFSTKNQSQISHVGIAISATQWIEAPYTGGVVRISALPSVSKIQAVRRVL